MSVESQDTDSTDLESTEETTFDLAVDAVLDELPERFEELSKTTDRDQLILTPSEGQASSDDEPGSIVFSRRQMNIMENHDFSFYFSSRARIGAGIHFWFQYNGDE